MLPSQKKFIERLDHFYWNHDVCRRIIEADPAGFEKLDQFRLSLSTSTNMMHLKETSAYTELLIKVLLAIYKFIYADAKSTHAPFFHCLNTASLENYLIESYMFTVLCSFIHTSSRIERKPYSKFLHEYNPLPSTDHISTETHPDADGFRKSRYRKLRQGKVFIPQTKWAAIPKDLEHELSFRFAIELEEPDLFDIYKRFGNLYNDLLKVVDPSKGNICMEAFSKAEKQFLSKLTKLDYSKYLRLQETIIDHICSNKEYCGINLYRLERTMAPYRIINDVNMLASHSFGNEAEADYLTRTAYLKDIPFPKIYHTLLFTRTDTSTIADHADTFDALLHRINFIGCLILDALIEEHFFGEDWENLFRVLSNSLAQDVLYDPDKFASPKLNGKEQEKFEKLLAAPIKLLAFAETADSQTVSTDSSC